MAKQLFRQVVLERLASPEQLDQTIKVVKPSSWLALLGIALFFVAIIVWSVVGTVPDKVLGQGVLLRAGQLNTVKSPADGLVQNVFVNQGDYVTPGQIIARLERSDLLNQIQLAQQRVDDLEQIYNNLVEFTSGNQALSNETSIRTQSNLRQQINVMNNQKADLQETVRNLESLFAEQLVTRQQLMASQAELASLDARIRDAETRLANISVTRFQASGEVNQQLTTLEQNINEALQQLDILQVSYRDQTKVTSSWEGVVVEVSVGKDDYIGMGSPIVKIEPSGAEIKNIQAVLYFSARDGKRIEPGMNIGISPSTVKQEEYGYIQGIVTEVSAFPVSYQYLMKVLQNDGLVGLFSREGPPIEVKADLIPDPNSVSGFRWSSSRGPSITLDSGLISTGSVTVRQQSPLSLVIPMINKNIFGVGDEEELLDRRAP